MALENLEPATRIESILDGEDIAPATRLEYFLKQAAAGGGGGGGIKELHQAEPFSVPDMETSGTKLFTPDVDVCVLWGGGEKINLDIYYVDTFEVPCIISSNNEYMLPTDYNVNSSENPPAAATYYGFGVLPDKTVQVLSGTRGPICAVVTKDSIAYYQCDIE